MQDPRYSEDKRLLCVPLSVGDVCEPCIIMCDGSYLPIKVVWQDISQRLSLNEEEYKFSILGNEDLYISRSLLLDECRLSDLPEASEVYFDYDLLGVNDLFVKILNLDEDIYTGMSLAEMNKSPDIIGKKTQRLQRMEKILKLSAKQELLKVEGSEFPVAIFSGGPSGGGKSAVIREAKARFGSESYLMLERDNLRSERSYIYLVATHDDVGEHLTDYRYIHNLFSRYHEIMIDYACDKKVNLIKDGSLSDKDNLRLFKKLHMSGIRVEAHFILVPIEVGVERNIDRFATENRMVPADVAREIGVNVMKNLVLYIASPLVDYLTISTNVGEVVGERHLIGEAMNIHYDELAMMRMRDDTHIFIVDGEKTEEETRIFCVYDEDALECAFDDARRHGVEGVYVGCKAGEEREWKELELGKVLSTVFRKLDSY